MNLLFTDEARQDYLYWQTADKQLLKKINALILQGCWSRRIDSEHRLVYELEAMLLKLLLVDFIISIPQLVKCAELAKRILLKTLVLKIFCF